MTLFPASLYFSDQRQTHLAVAANFLCLVQIGIFGERNLDRISGRKSHSCMRSWRIWQWRPFSPAPAAASTTRLTNRSNNRRLSSGFAIGGPCGRQSPMFPSACSFMCHESSSIRNDCRPARQLLGNLLRSQAAQAVMARQRSRRSCPFWMHGNLG